MINKSRLLRLLIAAVAILNASILLRDVAPLPTTVITFSGLFLIPGLLLLPLIGIKREDPIHYVYYTVCTSIIYLLGVGLLANTVLPLVGIDQPLRIDNTLPVLDTGFVLMLVAFWRRAQPFEWQFKRPAGKMLLLASVPLLWVIFAVAGAFLLNNGGPNGLTMIALIGILMNFIYLFSRANKLPQGVIAFHIFVCALTLLLMTSLRGWLITGHDIQREFYVFQLSKAGWNWNIAEFRDPYNACLSITILPTMLSGLLHIGDGYIYKVLFQILFALCPVAVYLLTKRLANRKLAVLSALYFVAFPTFFMDMPMLNRQEIAFLFFAGMLLLVKDMKQRYRARLLLFSLFGVGIVAAHYSTTYSMLLIFGGAMALCAAFEHKKVAEAAGKLFALVKREAPDFLGKRRHQSVVIFPVVVLLVLSAILWNVQVTGTSSGILDTFKNAFASISGNIDKDLKSTDTGVSLFGGAKADLASKVAAYKEDQDEIRDQIKIQDAYYPLSEIEKYPIRAAEEQPTPLTPFGEKLAASGINLYDFHYVLRQSSAKILQVLIAIGFFVLFLSKRHKFQMGTELTAVSIMSMFFLLMLVLVPVLSLNYGLLRAFQQVLIVLALPTVMGSLILLAKFPERLAAAFAVTIAAGFYLSSTGVLAELTGGYLAQLHLHNQGLYYDSYYIHEGELKAINWLDKNTLHSGRALQTDIEGDRFTVAKLGAVASYGRESSIYPGLIQRDSYVFIGYTNTQRGVVYALHNGEGITYHYPIDFLDNNKSLIYSSGQARVYR